jgi:FkbM family methyltransferase
MTELAPRPPLWFRAGRAAVRRLPFARFRAFEALAALGVRPFVDRLRADAGGYRYGCDLRDLVAREACLTGRYAPQEAALVRRSLREGDTFVDVGAHVGFLSLSAVHAVGPGGRVVAVEPHPDLVAELRRNVVLNGLDGIITVVHSAATARPGTVTLHGYADPGNRGVSTLDRCAGGGPAVEVPGAPLDSLLDAAGVGEVGLVKIDVEGAEAGVLGGMTAGIRDRRYRRVLMELHPWALGDYPATFRGIASRMRDGGFRGWAMDDDRRLARRAYYGSAADPRLVPLGGDPPGGTWPHVLWSLAGAGTP